MKHLIFISNESRSTLLGILCIYIKLQNTIDGDKWKLWLVIPKGKKKYIFDIIECCISLDKLTLIEAEISHDDIYFIQLGMIKIFENVEDSDFVIYLDYDHIINNPEIIEQLFNDKLITVSSEEKDYNTHNALGIDKHISISIIYSNGKKLKQIGRIWLESYLNCVKDVTYRYRTEISFYLASKKLGVEVKPCSVAIQSNFYSPYQNCAFFHYGGSSNNSKTMKNILEDTVNRYDKLTYNIVSQANDKLSSYLWIYFNKIK